MPKYEFTYPSVIESEARMLKDILKVLEKNEVVGLIKHSIMVVISEAFTNALTHGNQLDANKQINLVVDINKNEIVADITDEGQGGLGKIQSRQPSRMWAESGRGLGIIGHYASSFRFEETATGGLKVSIRFEYAKIEMLNKC